MIQPLESRVHLSAGEIDPYFGNAGSVTIESAGAVVMSDGRVVVARLGDHSFRMELQRLSRDGVLDPIKLPLN